MNKQPAGRLFICIIHRFSPLLTTSYGGMMEPILVVELDAKGEPTKIELLTDDEVELPGDCRIVLNPGVPPLHSKEFGPWLAKRNRELNPRWTSGVEGM